MENGTKGSLEILTADGRSIGLVGHAFTADAIPVVLEALYGITGLTEAPPRERANRLPVAEWTGTDLQGQPVTIVLWEEREFSATEIGQAILAAAMESQQEAP